MKHFRKRPIVVEAVKFDPQSSQEPPWWLYRAMLDGVVNLRQPCAGESLPSLSIQTLEGAMIVRNGDWIIRGVQGELYPCKSSIFEETYEEMPEVAAAT